MDQSSSAPAAPRHPAATLGPRANRTIARIKDATCQVFLTKGYAGTTIDEIATLAGVSRASFYTYFPSKREVLIAVGDVAISDCRALIDQLPTFTPSLDTLQAWVHEYFTLLDTHGSFAFAWTQAAKEDDEIRRVGMRAHLQVCRRLGEALGDMVGTTFPDPRTLGLTALSLIDRAWDFSQLYGASIDRAAVEAQVALTIWRTISS